MADSYMRLKRHLNGVMDMTANLERDYLEMVAHADEMMRQRDAAQDEIAQLKADRESLLSTCRAYGETAKGQNNTLADLQSQYEDMLRERDEARIEVDELRAQVSSHAVHIDLLNADLRRVRDQRDKTTRQLAEHLQTCPH